VYTVVKCREDKCESEIPAGFEKMTGLALYVKRALSNSKFFEIAPKRVNFSRSRD